MSISLHKDLAHAQKLIEKNKYDEAFQILLDFEKNKANTLYEKTLCRQFQCQLLIWKGKYEDAINLAERIHKDSLGLGEHLLAVDSLILMTDALIWEGYYTKAFDVINQAEELLKTPSVEEDYKQRHASIAYNKGRLYALQEHPELDLALDLLEQSLKLRKEIGNELDIVNSLLSLGHILTFRLSEPDRGLRPLKQALDLGKKIGNKYFIALVMRAFMLFYYQKGELDLGLKYAEQSLALFKEINNNSRMAPLLSVIGDFYVVNGDFNRALEYLEQALIINEELPIKHQNPVVIANFIEIYLKLGNLELANQYFKRLEQLNNRVENDWTKSTFRFCKASILKQSSRIIGLAEAEIILKEIIEEQGQWTNVALLQMCDLLLIELGMTKNEEILDEIKFYLSQLKNYAENSKAFQLLAETCLLQAKVLLITFNLKEARRLLIQGKQIAENRGFNQLIKKFSVEYDDLHKKLDLWEELKDLQPSLSERMELANISKQIGEMLRNRNILISQVAEDKVTIHKEQKICLVCKGEIGGYIYVCDCGAIYCENCAHALTELENACWVCNSPMDKSKPIKPYKKDEEGIDLKISSKEPKEPKK